ncbi:MAG: hypothetical protein LBH43_16970 [Treponema sp.]|jgi:hypothetical protein|nr:hypothetical protein [Treponema sp.]
MSNESMSVPVDNKNFIGIGKIIFDSNAEWNIPILHFMVDKTVSGNYEATLLEFGLVSWSESLNDAIRCLVKQTHSHIFSVLLRTGFEQLINEVDSHVMDGYWKHYRKIDFSLARIGKDLSHQINNESTKEMKAIISEERKNFLLDLSRDSAENIAENIVNELDKIPSLSGFVFEELMDAA